MGQVFPKIRLRAEQVDKERARYKRKRRTTGVGFRKIERVTRERK